MYITNKPTNTHTDNINKQYKPENSSNKLNTQVKLWQKSQMWNVI